MTNLNPFRFIGDYIAVHVQPDTDVQATLELCLNKSDFFQAILIILASHLTSSVLADMLILAEQSGERNRIGYALSEDSESLERIQRDAIMVIDALPKQTDCVNVAESL